MHPFKCKIGIYRGDEYSNLRFAETSNQRVILSGPGFLEASVSSFVILNGSEVLRGSYVEPSKTCARAGIYDEISTTFLRKVTFYM